MNLEFLRAKDADREIRRLRELTGEPEADMITGIADWHREVGRLRALCAAKGITNDQVFPPPASARPAPKPSRGSKPTVASRIGAGPVSSRPASSTATSPAPQAGRLSRAQHLAIIKVIEPNVLGAIQPTWTDDEIMIEAWRVGFQNHVLFPGRPSDEACANEWWRKTERTKDLVGISRTERANHQDAVDKLLGLRPGTSILNRK